MSITLPYYGNPSLGSNPFQYKVCPACGQWRFYLSTFTTAIADREDPKIEEEKKSWECFKCNTVYAPHIDECKKCSLGVG